MKNPVRIAILTALLLGLTVFATACGGSDDKKSPSPTPATSTSSKSFPAGSTMDQIVKRGKITIGVKYDVPLFGVLDPLSRKVDGFDVAFGKAIADALGLKDSQIEFVEAISANRIPMLQQDKADLVISTMTITDDRKQQIEFSRPYYLAGQSILVKKDNIAINSVDDLNGRKVCTAAGSTSETSLMQKAPQAKLISLATYSACVTALKDGSADAVSTDDIILAGFAATDKDLKLVGAPFTSEAYGIGMKKGKTDMQKFVDDQLTAMLTDGRWEKLYTQYLGNVEGFPSAAAAKAKLPVKA